MLLALVAAVALSAYALLVLALCRMAADADIALGMKQEVGEHKADRLSAAKLVRLDERSTPAHRGGSQALIDITDYANRPSARTRVGRRQHT